MIYEVCELIATHLRDPQLGIAALSPHVPLNAGDPAVEEVMVLSEFEVDYLAGVPVPKELYATGPVVLVRRGDDVGEFSPAGNPEIAAADSRVGVAVLVLYPRETANALTTENRRLSAVLRALRASIGLFFERVPYDARELRAVQIVGLVEGSTIRLVPTVAMVSERDLMAGAVLLDCAVTDRWAEIDPLPNPP